MATSVLKRTEKYVESADLIRIWVAVEPRVWSTSPPDDLEPLSPTGHFFHQTNSISVLDMLKI
jgi:hypothetical protein